MTQKAADEYVMARLRYVWLAGYDESREPDDIPDWADSLGSHEGAGSEETDRFDGSTLTVYHHERPDEYVKSDMHVTLSDYE